MLDIALSGQMFDDCSIWEHLEAASAFGYRGVELRSTHVKPSTPGKELEQIREYLRNNGLRVNCLSCFTGNYGLLTEAGCEEAYHEFCRYINLAIYFDADLIRVWPAWQSSVSAPQEVWDRAVRWMALSAEAAAVRGRRIAMEMHHGTLCDTPESSLRLLKRIENENVGLIFDPVNLYQTPVELLAEAIPLLGKHIFDVHVKDIIRLESGAHPGSFRYDYYARHIGRFTNVVPPESDREDYYAHRRIGHGALDWQSLLEALNRMGYTGMLGVESVNEKDCCMPSGRALAKTCIDDLTALYKYSPSIRNWHAVSPDAPGMHEVITPGSKPCKAVLIYRLNLPPSGLYRLDTGRLEMNAVVIAGDTLISGGGIKAGLNRLDSFYLPGKHALSLTAGNSGAVLYIGAAVCDGIGKPFFRRYDPLLPVGTVHQVHGEGPHRREVFFTLDEQMPASRLICGITRGQNGGWTSWPPHQHERDLEEVYCYFDMPETGKGLHLSYLNEGGLNTLDVYAVSNGHMVLAPKGYHPTVAMPGVSNTYFWVLAAFTPESRSYNLVQRDPELV